MLEGSLKVIFLSNEAILRQANHSMKGKRPHGPRMRCITTDAAGEPDVSTLVGFRHFTIKD